MASRSVVSARLVLKPMRSTAWPRPEPMPRRTRPPDSSSSAPISMAISVGCRPNGLNTPAPMLWVLVASAQAAAAVMMPRAKGFSANQTASMPAASAARACSAQACGVIPPCSRTLSLGSFADMPLDAARPRAGISGREMRVHHAPGPLLLAEHHGRARDEFLAAVVDVLRRRLLAGPLSFGVAMAPDHGEIAGHHAADIERRPVGRRHVLTVELPEPDPVVPALISMAVEVEIG